MSIAPTVEQYLIEHRIPYDLVAHPHTESSLQSAAAAHVPEDRMAKVVVLENRGGYVMVVLPATRQVELHSLRKELNRDVHLATESTLNRLFRDCECGAIPPLGPAYGMETLVDEDLAAQPDIYFEAGDHQELIHLPTERFLALLGPVRQGRFSRAP